MRNNNAKSMKTTTPCCSKIGMKRGPWTPEEDEKLIRFIAKEGEGRWRTLPNKAGLQRCGKSCRLRWMNYLRPSIKRGHIAPDEEDLILRLHRLLGNRWSLIAGRIPGRTDNEIKNYWNSHLSKKLISQGIDPTTHKPLNHSNVTRPSSSKSKGNTVIPNHNSSASLLPNNSHNNKKRKNNLSHVVLDSPGRIGNTINPNSVDESEKQLKMDNNTDNQFSGYDADDYQGEDGAIINCCTDNNNNNNDVLSSFLNSLINEEMFIFNQQQKQEEELQQHETVFQDAHGECK